MLVSPWAFNTASPNRYRMRLAERFSQEGRRVFGKRWKGVYVFGSTASKMAHHYADLDVAPLVEGIRGSNGIESEKWEALENAAEKLEKERGIGIEVWTVRAGTRALNSTCTLIDKRPTLELFRGMGAEKLIASEAVLVDAGEELGLPQKIERPELRDCYKECELAALRGEGKLARTTRIDVERELGKRREKLLGLLKENLPRLEFGDFQACIAAFALIDNFIPRKYSVLKGVGLYEAFEFLLSSKREFYEFIGFVPNVDNLMHKGFMQIIKALQSPEGRIMRRKLSELRKLLKENGFRFPALLSRTLNNPLQNNE